MPHIHLTAPNVLFLPPSESLTFPAVLPQPRGGKNFQGSREGMKACPLLALLDLAMAVLSAHRECGITGHSNSSGYSCWDCVTHARNKVKQRVFKILICIP